MSISMQRIFKLLWKYYVHLNLNEHFQFIGGENYTIALKKEDIFDKKGIQVILLGSQLEFRIR